MNPPVVSDASLIFAVLLLGSITFCYRFSFISSPGRAIAEKIPVRLLNLLAPASFAAIIMNNLLSSQKDPVLFKQKLLVAGFSIVFAYFTRQLIGTLVFGLVALYLIRLYS